MARLQTHLHLRRQPLQTSPDSLLWVAVCRQRKERAQEHRAREASEKGSRAARMSRKAYAMNAQGATIRITRMMRVALERLGVDTPRRPLPLPLSWTPLARLPLGSTTIWRSCLRQAHLHRWPYRLQITWDHCLGLALVDEVTAVHEQCSAAELLDQVHGVADHDDGHAL